MNFQTPLAPPTTVTVTPVHWFKRLVGLMGNDRQYAVSALVAAAAVVIAGLGSPLVIRRLLDGQGSRSLWLGVLLFLGVIRSLTIYVRRWHAGRLSAGTEATLRRLIHDHLQTLDPITHDALAQGQVVSRANADVGLIGGLLSFGPLLSSTVVQLALSIVVMATLSITLTFIVVALFPPLFLLGTQLRRWTFPANLDALAKVGDLTTKAEEAISGVRVVKSFGQERRELESFDKETHELCLSWINEIPYSLLRLCWPDVLGCWIDARRDHHRAGSCHSTGGVG